MEEKIFWGIEMVVNQGFEAIIKFIPEFSKHYSFIFFSKKKMTFSLF